MADMQNTNMAASYSPARIAYKKVVSHFVMSSTDLEKISWSALAALGRPQLRQSDGVCPSSGTAMSESPSGLYDSGMLDPFQIAVAAGRPALCENERAGLKTLSVPCCALDWGAKKLKINC